MSANSTKATILMKATIPNISVLKKVIDAISKLITQVNVDFDEDGISFQAMDSSHVSLVKMKLNASALVEYQIKKSISLGLSIPSLKKILSLSRESCSVTLTHSNPDFLDIEFGEHHKHKFSMKLMDIDAERLAIPETTHAFIVTIPADSYTSLIGDATKIADTLSITVSPSSMLFKMTADDCNGTILIPAIKEEPVDGSSMTMVSASEITYDEDGEVVLSDSTLSLIAPKAKRSQKKSAGDTLTCKINSTQNAKNQTVTLATRYLHLFASASTLSVDARIKFQEDSPMLFEFDILDGDKKLGEIGFYLAPKIDDENETN